MRRHRKVVPVQAVALPNVFSLVRLSVVNSCSKGRALAGPTRSARRRGRAVRGGTVRPRATGALETTYAAASNSRSAYVDQHASDLGAMLILHDHRATAPPRVLTKRFCDIRRMGHGLRDT